MPYMTTGATIYIQWKCSRCGASGITEYDGDEYADGSYGVLAFPCPECGLDLDSSYDLDEMDEQFKEENEDEEDYDD